MKIQINYGRGAYCNAMDFKEVENPAIFFNILPIDWQESIVPYWDEYKSSTKCFALFDNDKLIAGGLVFSECPPDMIYVKEEADSWFHKGYLYLGFIYVLEEHRGKNLGSVWLSNLKKMFPKQKFWLTIEDAELHGFYAKNGFVKVKTLNNKGHEDIVYCYNGKN